VAEVAAQLGTPLMPWQQYVVDVALELDPETGQLAYREVVLTVPRQSGKALDCETEILTANRGWTTMAGIQVGDRVFHPAGHDVVVTFVSDVMVGHACYRVTTTDGRSVVADADHLWTVADRNSRRSEFRTLTTRELIAAGYVSRKPSGATGYRFQLPAQGVLKSPEVDLPLDPYLLGAWLGDGWSRQALLASHKDDVPHWVDAIRAAGYVPAVYERPSACAVAIRADNSRSGWKARSFQAGLRELGLISDKHVPDDYLRAGPQQREALLQGLLDTDGTISAPQGRVEFSATNRRLADAVLLLARSLGWRATMREDRSTYLGQDCGAEYRVFFTPKQDDPYAPFRLARKLARVHPGGGYSDGRRDGRSTVSIRSIEPVPSVPVRCIKVDSPDGLFLAGRDLVATHNTTLIMGVGTHRALGFGQRQVIRYGAQTRNDARMKWEDDLVVALEASPLKKLFRVRKTNGNEAILFRNGSRWGITANTEKSGHGGTLDLAFLDEAFSQVDARLEQAFKPAMITRKSPQLWVVSTAGTEQSTYLLGKRDKGRQLVEDGVTRGVAYFEWSAPEDADPADRDVWRSCMPALRCNGGLIEEDAVEADFKSMDLPEFQRAYLNQWVSKDVHEPVILHSVWEGLADPASQLVGQLVFALDATPDRSGAAVAVAGRRADGVGHVEVVDARPGTGWVLDRVVELDERHKPAGWVLDPASAAGAWLPALQEAGIEPVLVTGREMAQACGALYEDVVENGAFRHLDQPQLNAALSGARRRPVGDAWGWHRRDSSVDISPLVAVTLAWHGVALQEATPKKNSVPTFALVDW